jgi:hypothetical protein
MFLDEKQRVNRLIREALFLDAVLITAGVSALTNRCGFI